MNFSKRINIIIGPNNSGKSTIIKSLYKLQDLTLLKRNDIRTNENNYSILINIANVNDAEKEGFKNEKNILLPVENEACLFFQSFESDVSTNQIEQNSYQSIKYSLENIQASNTSGNYSFIKFLGFPTAEDKGNFIYPFLAKRKNNQLNTQGGKEVTYSVTDSFYNLTAKIKKVTSHPIKKAKFQELCKDIIGFELGIIPGDGNEDKIGMYAGVIEKNLPIPIESMGEGVVNIIGLIIILLTENQKLFLIEELENDIHPSALKKLLKLIIEKSETNQFIISTHSNIILKYLGSVNDSKIFSTQIEYSAEKNIFSSAVNEMPNNSESRIKALEELGYEFADYDLHEGWLFFEESSAEEIIREYFINWYFPNTKLTKFKTFSARSLSEVEAKFESFNKLFVYLHLTEIYKNKAWVIIDAGENESKIITKLKYYYKKNGWSDRNFMQWSKHDFEDYYPDFFRDRVAKIAAENSEMKRLSKAQLLKDVKDWIEKDNENAKNEFSKSAAEVIEILKGICD